MKKRSLEATRTLDFSSYILFPSRWSQWYWFFLFPDFFTCTALAVFFRVFAGLGILVAIFTNCHMLRLPASSILAAGSIEEQRSFTRHQVITETQTASDLYKRTVFARMCEESDASEHWIPLLTTGNFTSTISGAFVQVCNV